MRKFRDIESGKIVTEEVLRKEYLERLKEQPEEFSEISFAEYLSNSLTSHNGTLEEVNMEQTARREEVIIDATQEAYAVYGDELSDLDSRDIVKEIRKFADFWMEAYEKILGDTIPEDSYLEYVTLASLVWFKSWLGYDLSEDDELMLCNNQRVAQYVRNHKTELTLVDYDWWSHLEEIIGEPITCDEYRKIDAGLPDDVMEMTESDHDYLKARLGYIRTPKEKVPVYAFIKTMVKTWVEVPKGSGREAILAEAKENIIECQYEDDDGWDIEESDILEYSIDWEGVQDEI